MPQNIIVDRFYSTNITASYNPGSYRWIDAETFNKNCIDQVIIPSPAPACPVWTWPGCSRPLFGGLAASPCWQTQQELGPGAGPHV